MVQHSHHIMPVSVTNKYSAVVKLNLKKQMNMNESFTYYVS